MNGPPGTAPCHLPAIGPDTPARRLAGHCPECMPTQLKRQHGAASASCADVRGICHRRREACARYLGRLGDGVIGATRTGSCLLALFLYLMLALPGVLSDRDSIVAPTTVLWAQR